MPVRAPGFLGAGVSTSLFEGGGGVAITWAADLPLVPEIQLFGLMRGARSDFGRLIRLIHQRQTGATGMSGPHLPGRAN